MGHYLCQKQKSASPTQLCVLLVKDLLTYNRKLYVLSHRRTLLNAS
jgi:hypothetical protein